MITASHNPKQDNGYKLYWGDGCQIQSPRDKKIARNIRQSEDFWCSDYASVFSKGNKNHLLKLDLTEETLGDYLAEAHRGLKRLKSVTEAPVKIVYSAFHGVGGPYVMQIFERFGLSAPIVVAEQHEIDPDFPTVEFPNPEEGAGALHLSFETAKRHGAEVILANDPDADRLAVAEKSASGSGFRTFSGNEIAALLADWLWRNRDQSKAPEQYAMVASTVSSKFLRSMARAEGFEFREALTGFKWLSHAALDLKNECSKDVLLTYEEAIGFLCGTAVLDKDGVSAAAVFAELSYSVYQSGSCLAQRLQELERSYGRHVNYNGYLRVPCSGFLKRQFDHLRQAGLPSCFESAGGEQYAVESVRDLTLGTDTGTPDGIAVLPQDASSQFLTFRIRSPGTTLGADIEVSLRGSGTEPKVKYYSELVSTEHPAAPADENGEDEHAALLRDAVESVIARCLEPEKHGLERPSW